MSGMAVLPVVEQRETDLLRGVLDTCVLALLTIEPTHAYDVVEKLRSRGFSEVGYGTVYPLVTRLKRQGLLTQEAQPSPQGPARLVLSLTQAGQAALKAWRDRWEHTAATVAEVFAELDDQGSTTRKVEHG